MSDLKKKSLIIESSSDKSEENSEEKDSLEEDILDIDLKTEFEKLSKDACKDENYYSTDCNKFLLSVHI